MKIKVDSRKVVLGDTFIAIPGIERDGHDYIDEAISNGAKTIIAEKGKYSVETIIVKSTKEYLENYLKSNYYKKIKDIKIIGITGTNGKTTTSYVLHKCLNLLGIKCAYIGTIGFYIDNKIKDLNNTTPNLYDLYEMLIKCKECECQYLIIEISSHALSLNRLDSIKYDYAVFTNLTKDHLDYHKSFKNYALAKQKLFKKIKTKGKCFINIDDDYKDYFLLKDNNNITYGIGNCNYQISDCKINSNTTIFKINDEEYQTILLGKHNIYNLTVVIAFLKEIGIKENEIKEVIGMISSPKGRMDTIYYNDNTIIIDYAHTPDAVSKIINTVRDFNPNSIYTIIGCGGNRDKTKRPEMALIATSLSDKVIFTSDNPRNEKPKNIIKDMTNELVNNNYKVVVNRKKAIKKGIQMLQKNDILLVLGKGHENYQIIGQNKNHFDDKEEVLKITRR